MDEEPEPLTTRRRPVARRALIGLVLLLALALLILWVERRPIASGYVHRALARRGVQASYRLTRIGPRTERIENLVIGDPRDPDLVARSVELRLSWDFLRPAIVLIVARGLRLKGRIENGKLRLGQLDRLMQPAAGGPFRLPDRNIDIADAIVRLESPAGRIAVALEGKGNLADGFRGRMAAASPRLAAGGCAASRVRARWSVAVDRARARLDGPAGLDRLGCGKLTVAGARIGLDVTLAPALDSWRGTADVALASARFAGDRADGLSGRLSFDGDAAATGGALDLAAARSRAAGFSAGPTRLAGRYRTFPRAGRVALAGRFDARGAAADRALIAPAARALDSARGTPVGPVASAWTAALLRAARGFDAQGAVTIVPAPGGASLRLAGLEVSSRSGARFSFAGGGGIAYSWPSGKTRFDGDFSLVGGGLPHARFSLYQPDAAIPVRGVGRIAPERTGGAGLAVSEIRFGPAPGGGTVISTVATIDGPFAGGRVAGLTIPLRAEIDGRGGFALGPGCAAARFERLEAGNLRLGPTSLPVCPIGRALVWKDPGGPVQAKAVLRAPRMAGMLGSMPIALGARDLRLSRAGFGATGLAIRLGAGARASRIDAATLDGGFGKRGLSGSYSGLAGKLAGVPLLLSDGQGPWSYGGGNGRVAGSVRIADEAGPPRFVPLVSRDFRLTLTGESLRAEGWLDEPKTGKRILEARIEHDLRSGSGRALLDVPGLAFDEHFQPEQLTRLTVGVVALVRGTVRGKGEIDWDSRGSGSRGLFSTEGMNLAAAFGPVEGLTTSLHFTDLIGLVTAPGQVAEVKAIRTGVDVFDGHILYRLLPGQTVKVEGAHWPFAGGTLTLDETVLDFSAPAARSLTFRVTAMDGARFVQLMEFSNISGTGTFDGIVPMVFDEHGGRVIGGHLVARPAGGTLSYVGELTDKQLGAYGKLAFDALKSLRYSRLIVDLDGALEGEFVAGIRLDGIARNPAVAATPGGGISGMVVGRALGQLAKIPFKFNISVRGPFRAVIGTARSLQDPTNLIQSVLPQRWRDKPIATVQPHESETVP